MLRQCSRIGAALLAYAIGQVAVPLAHATIALASYSRQEVVTSRMGCGCTGKRRLRWPVGIVAAIYIAAVSAGAVCSALLIREHVVVGHLLVALFLVALVAAIRDMRRAPITYRACSCAKYPDDNFHGGAPA